MTDPPKPPEILNRFVRMVLSYHPKPKSQPAKKRQRLAREARRAGQPADALAEITASQPDTCRLHKTINARSGDEPVDELGRGLRHIG